MKRSSPLLSRVGKLTSSTGGKKPLVRKRTQGVLQRRQLRSSRSALSRWSERSQASQPVLETKSRKRSGRAIQVPKRVSPSRGLSRSSSWRLDSLTKRSKKQGSTWASSRLTERLLAHEELGGRSGQKGTEFRSSKSKLQSEWRSHRSRIHKAAKANRVNRTK